MDYNDEKIVIFTLCILWSMVKTDLQSDSLK